MRVRCWIVVPALLAELACGSQDGPSRTARIGYSAEDFATQADLEQRFRAGVSPDPLSEIHRQVTQRPHPAGSDGAREVVSILRDTLASAGLQVEILEYQAYLSSPREVGIEIVSPEKITIATSEPPSSFDPQTSHPELGVGYVAYSASGDVTAPVIYVNYGLPVDYEQLDALGVGVKGKLVVARYGRSHRAVKVHTAQERGALGVILYSDPADDGSGRGETWPTGYWRGEQMLQRGNAKYSWFWHGDPLTPGVPALEGASRLTTGAAPTLPKIPVTAIAWGEARKILERMSGPTVPSSFQGGVPVAYTLGDDRTRVRLHVRMDDGLRTIRNVVAHVPGARQPNREVLLGTHHDAWTFGGVDPGTGMAALIGVARGLGELQKSGWQPDRTIKLAFWDAEEYGLIGSTEYAEQRLRELREGTICYINTDLYMAGRLDVGGVPSLRDFLIEVTRDVPDHDSPMYEAWRANEWARQPEDRRQRGDKDFEVDLKSLGSGADFVPFQDHLGIPTLSIELVGGGGYGYGTYHSNYDTRRYAEQVADPGFRRGVQLAQLLGTTALRLAQAPVVPFRFSHYGRRLTEFAQAAEGWGVAAGGRGSITVDVSKIRALAALISERSTALEREIDQRLANRALPEDRIRPLNDLLARMEQRLLDEQEPAERRWYRHVVYGWNIYSLYDGQPFPGLAEAIRVKDPARVQQETARIEAALTRLADGLSEAHEVLE